MMLDDRGEKLDVLIRLKRLLNCDNLIDDWNFYYGISESRRKAIARRKSEAKSKRALDNSFFNCCSETPLTLFFLGNIDGWKQIGTLAIMSRRPANDRWDKAFFDNIRSGSESIFCNIPVSGDLWFCDRALRKKLFGDSAIDPQSLILLFEFEIMNSAFHSIESGVFKKLSFLDIGIRKDWLTYDAVLMDPNCKLFTFIEAKYLRDIGGAPPGAPYNDQLIRGLESAFLLTNHRNSLYSRWDFRYVFICPEGDVGRSKTYRGVLASEDSIRRRLCGYGRDIRDRGRHQLYRPDEDALECYFDSFVEQVPSRCSMVYWSELGKILPRDFFQSYFSGLESSDLQDDEVEVVKGKFLNAISTP